MRNLCSNKQHCGSILAGSDTCATANAFCCIHGFIGNYLGDGKCVAIRCAPDIRGNITACLGDAVEGRAIADEVAKYWESFSPPRFDYQGLAIGEVAHVSLAGGASGWAMGPAVNY